MIIKQICKQIKPLKTELSLDSYTLGQTELVEGGSEKEGSWRFGVREDLWGPFVG